jgi:hypothetical protein
VVSRESLFLLSSEAPCGTGGSLTVSRETVLRPDYGLESPEGHLTAEVTTPTQAANPSALLTMGLQV